MTACSHSQDLICAKVSGSLFLFISLIVNVMTMKTGNKSRRPDFSTSVILKQSWIKTPLFNRITCDFSETFGLLE